jgi:hypothetical protein
LINVAEVTLNDVQEGRFCAVKDHVEREARSTAVAAQLTPLASPKAA